MEVEKITISKVVATKKEKQAMKDGMEMLSSLDNITNGSCEHCPLAKMCDNAPCEVGCLIHFSQKSNRASFEARLLLLTSQYWHFVLGAFRLASAPDLTSL